MARVLVEELSLEHIADAIREKLDVETTYKPAEMADAILDIEGYPEPTGTKSITANGTDIDVKDFATANVNVPNSYSQSDEGKVVSNGALVAQTSENITDNGTYDTTLKNEVVVNVSGGGGGEPFIASAANDIVDTHVNTNSVYGIRLEFEPITVAVDYQIYASGVRNNFTIAAMKKSMGVTKGYIRCADIDFGVFTFVKGKNVIECRNGKVTVNGTQASGSYSGAIGLSSNLYLFGYGSSYGLSHIKIFKCTLYDANGNIMREFVPASDSNDVPCILDTVSGSYIHSNNNRLVYGADL